MSKISIVIPFHWMQDWEFFLNRCLKSIHMQSFSDYEIVMMKVSTMPITSNRVMEGAHGELIKILYMDDYFAHPNSLQEIVDNFKEEDHWLVTGCVHKSRDDEVPHSPHYPLFDIDGLKQGINKIGSPSVLTIRSSSNIWFDERMSWMLDTDLYIRMAKLYGEPKILNDLNVVIGIGDHQMTRILNEYEKSLEHELLVKKYL